MCPRPYTVSPQVYIRTVSSRRGANVSAWRVNVLNRRRRDELGGDALPDVANSATVAAGPLDRDAFGRGRRCMRRFDQSRTADGDAHSPIGAGKDDFNGPASRVADRSVGGAFHFGGQLGAGIRRQLGVIGGLAG